MVADMKETNYCCSFTGHRPAKLPFANENSQGCTALKNRLYKEIKDMVDCGILTFYTGMAEGVDIWCAEIVLALRCIFPEKNIALNAVVPYKGQERYWDEAWKSRYNEILSIADNVTIMHEKYVNGCLFERNRYLVDVSDYIIGVFCNTSGGTKYTLDYAKKNGRNIIIIDPSMI